MESVNMLSESSNNNRVGHDRPKNRGVPELRTSILSFCFGACLNFALFLIEPAAFTGTLAWFLMHSLAFSPVFIVLSFFLFNKESKVGIHGCFLGCVVCLGILLRLSPLELWHSFGVYMCVMGFFHWSEYVCTALTSPSTLSIDSFLLNHSVQYWIAAGASWLEFVLGIFFVPSLKTLPVVSAFGFLLCIIGESLRKCAMLTAGRNFTHLISYQKKGNHELITTGIYSIFRHPSYIGWFLWSAGTQVLLCNPICFVGYVWASWNFFRVRIEDEEVLLINFFGEEYVHYQRRVPTGIPFILGYRPDMTD